MRAGASLSGVRVIRSPLEGARAIMVELPDARRRRQRRARGAATVADQMDALRQQSNDADLAIAEMVQRIAIMDNELCGET